jgi:hypothetical protein
MLDDKLEWIETFEMIEKGEEIVQSDFPFGKYITIKKEAFDKFIEEINIARLKAAGDTGTVDLIVIGESDEDN